MPRACASVCATSIQFWCDFSYAPGLADCLRITVGTPQENDEVLAAFAALVKEEM